MAWLCRREAPVHADKGLAAVATHSGTVPRTVAHRRTESTAPGRLSVCVATAVGPSCGVDPRPARPAARAPAAARGEETDSVVISQSRCVGSEAKQRAPDGVSKRRASDGSVALGGSGNGNGSATQKPQEPQERTQPLVPPPRLKLAVGRRLEYRFTVDGQTQWFAGTLRRERGGEWADVAFDDGKRCCVKMQLGVEGTVWRWQEDSGRPSPRRRPEGPAVAAAKGADEQVSAWKCPHPGCLGTAQRHRKNRTCNAAACRSWARENLTSPLTAQRQEQTKERETESDRQRDKGHRKRK
eukprot:COSAG03_NODE_1872_length_3401_cov_1.450636_1_plen_297_part_10